jgi:Bifunctional DNA primase/polymerase, N-terminal
VTRTANGWHYWYTVGEMPHIRSELAAGVDIRHGDTGMVVAPPSIHPSGVVYRWINPPIGAPAMAPTWLLAMLTPPVYIPPPPGDHPTGSGQFSVQCLIARIISAPEGRRNRTTFGACRDAARQGDLDAFEYHLVAAALSTGLHDHEVATILRSARK